MKAHLRFSIAYWHTMTQDGSDPFGDPVNQRTWFGADPMETARNRVNAFFELLEKLDVEYFCFHDVAIALSDVRTIEQCEVNMQTYCP